MVFTGTGGVSWRGRKLFVLFPLYGGQGGWSYGGSGGSGRNGGGSGGVLVVVGGGDGVFDGDGIVVFVKRN